MEKKKKIIYCSFNQDLSCVSISLENRIIIFNCEDLSLLYSYSIFALTLDMNASIIEMLYSSNIIAIVGNNEVENFSPKKVTIWGTDTNNAIMKLSFPYKIDAVKLNKSRYLSNIIRLIISIKDGIHLYNMTNLMFVHSISVNLALTRLAFSPSSEKCYLAYSDSVDKGVVNVYAAKNVIAK